MNVEPTVFFLFVVLMFYSNNDKTHTNEPPSLMPNFRAKWCALHTGENGAFRLLQYL